ncbi:Dynein heavy chain 5, partial [Blattella germanica]
LLNQFTTTVRRVKLEVRPLFLPQLVRLSSLLSPALNSITWTDSKWKDFVENTTEAIKSFDILVTRVHDVYTNRILQVLSSMQKATLQALPTDEPWTVEEFLENTEDSCRFAAVELHRKSLMVEEAVEEVLELVKKAAQAFKANTGADDFDFLTEGENKGGGGQAQGEASSAAAASDGSAGSQQQQDWSIVWEYFDNPHKLLSQPGGGLSKVMQEMVRNAVAEMRRYYSRKVVDVLIKVTRHSLDCLRKRFSPDSDLSGL